MFKIEVVDACPVSEASRGVMQMTPDLVSTIAGAVRDNIEWIALLQGKRSEDGFTVEVEKFIVPQQYRTAGDAEMVSTEIDASIVGVIHSHHTMGAFFSGTDTSTLNPRFPSSIVVAQARNNLGFDYKAVGKVVLPCGAVGEVKFALEVSGVQRFAQQVVRAEHTGDADDLGDCLHYEVADVDDYTQVEKASCGLSAVVDRPLMFGQDGKQFLEVVREQTLHRAVQSPKWNQNKGNTYTTGQYNHSSNGDGGGARGKKRGSRRGRLYATRSDGLFRVDDTADDVQFPIVCKDPLDYNAPGGIFTVGSTKCGECHDIGKRLRKHEFMEVWLCEPCWGDMSDIIVQCTRQESEEAGVIRGSMVDDEFMDERTARRLAGDVLVVDKDFRVVNGSEPTPAQLATTLEIIPADGKRVHQPKWTIG